VLDVGDSVAVQGVPSILQEVLSAEDVQRGEKRRQLVVVRHGSGAAFLRRQPRLRAVERLNLALLVDRKDDGVSRRIDIEDDDVAQFVDELWIVGKFELAHSVRLETMGAPDALNGTEQHARNLRHHRAGPVRRLAGWVLERHGDDPFGDLVPQGLDARGPRLVAKQSFEVFFHEPFLPAPDARFGFAGSAHDLVRADPVGAEQDDFSPPYVSIPDEGLEPGAIGSRYCDGYSWAHAEESHAPLTRGIPKGIQA
jgi:hypothetical protein